MELITIKSGVGKNIFLKDIDDFESLKVNLDYINDIKMMEILKKNEKIKKFFIKFC